MTQVDRLKELLKGGEIYRMGSLIEAGITGATVRRAVAAGLVTQLSRGTYQLANATPTDNVELALALARIPRGLICLHSAAKAHGLIDQAPGEVWVAIHNRENSPKVDSPPIRLVRWVDRQALIVGVQTLDICGVEVQITTPARTAVDMLRMRKLVSLGDSLEALKRYLDDGGAKSELFEVADQLGALKQLEPLLGFAVRGSL